MATMNKTYKTISKLLIELDPIGLISSGAPEDEYGTETRDVYWAYVKSRNKADFENEFIKIFVESFGLISSKGLDNVAKKIYYTLKKIDGK